METNPISLAKSQGTGEGLDVSTIRLMEVPSVPPAGSGEGLNVGAVKLMEVPAVPLGSYSPDGQDTDLSNQVRPEIRKPDQFEKFIICVPQLFETVLLVLRTGVNGYDVRYYCVEPALQREVASAMKAVVVIPWWSFRDRRWSLWVVNASEESSYFANLKPILEQPEEYYRGVSFTVETKKDGGPLQVSEISGDPEIPRQSR